MSYKILSIRQEPKHLIRELMSCDISCVIIPPYYSDKAPEIPEPPQDQKYVGLFSSGTTGTPKCIWNTYSNLIQNARDTAQAFEISYDDRLMMLAAPWHVAGISWALMAEHLGYDYQFIATKKGEEDKWHKILQKYEPDYLMTVPGVLRLLFRYRWKVSCIVYGGAPLNPQEMPEMARHCSEFFQGYGQTEAGGLIAVRKFDALPDRITDEWCCCGKPIEGVYLRCEGTPENPFPIFVRSRTAHVPEEFNTGDLGYINAKNHVHVVGRADDLANGR